MKHGRKGLYKGWDQALFRMAFMKRTRIGFAEAAYKELAGHFAI